MAGPRLLSRFLGWLGKHELAVLLGFAGIACGIWLFALIADEVKEGATQQFDRTLMLAFRHPGDLSPIGPPWVLESARDVTALGGATALTLLTLITGGFLILDGKRRMAVFAFVSIASGLLMSNFLKEVFHRPRPDVVPYAASFSSTSFPSGHSMLSAVTYLSLGALLARSQERRRLKAYSLLVAGLLTFLVGVSRVYLGVHWPTDVLAGWAAGGTWAILCWLVARVLQRLRTLEAEAEHEP